MVLADSAVWINHLRQRDAVLEELIAREEVLSHPYVVGEIALELDLAVPGVGDDGAEQSDLGPVLRFASRVQVSLQAGEQLGHEDQPWRVRRFFRTAAFIFRFRRSLGFS